MHFTIRSVLLLALLTLPAATQETPWQTVSVPGPRKASEAAAADGLAWYRAWVKVDDGFFAKHERNLFVESVGVHVRGLAGAHEVWVNGRKIGTGGSFPPDYRSSGDALYRHKVPVGTLKKGDWNEIAVRVYTPPDAGPGGFQGEAPF